MDNEDWIAELGEAFGQQIPLYNLFPEEKVNRVLNVKFTILFACSSPLFS